MKNNSEEIEHSLLYIKVEVLDTLSLLKL